MAAGAPAATAVFARAPTLRLLSQTAATPPLRLAAALGGWAGVQGAASTHAVWQVQAHGGQGEEDQAAQAGRAQAVQCAAYRPGTGARGGGGDHACCGAARSAPPPPPPRPSRCGRTCAPRRVCMTARWGRWARPPGAAALLRAMQRWGGALAARLHVTRAPTSVRPPSSTCAGRSWTTTSPPTAATTAPPAHATLCRPRCRLGTSAASRTSGACASCWARGHTTRWTQTGREAWGRQTTGRGFAATARAALRPWPSSAKQAAVGELPQPSPH